MEIEKHYFKIKWLENVRPEFHNELYVRKSEALNMTCPAAQVRMYSMFGVLCFLFHLEFSKIHPIP
jgi:hypothetical protein